MKRPMVGVLQRFGRQSMAENPNSSGPCQDVEEEPGLHHPRSKSIPCVSCSRSARCSCVAFSTPSPLDSQFAPPPCPASTGAEGRFSGALAITPFRKNECVQRHAPPPTFGQLKQTEVDDEETDVLDRFSVYVVHSGGDWQTDRSV